MIKIKFQLASKIWSSFVHDHPCGNIFQIPEMCEIYEQTKNYEPLFIAVVNDNEEILGILLAVIQKEHSGILGRFTARSIIWGGPLVKDNNPEVLGLILKEYRKIIKGKAIYTQFRNHRGWSPKEKEIFRKNGFTYEDHLDILFDLNKSEADLFKEMHKGRRKNIKRAERIQLEFVEIQDTNDFEKCLTLIKKTYSRVKLPCPDRTFFYYASKVFNDKCSFIKFSVKFKDEIIGCRFLLCYKGLVYDWFAGTDEKHHDKYPNDYLLWKIFQWAKENNYSTFDFGGAGKPNKQYGVRDYKLKFGGELVNFGRFEMIHQHLFMYIGELGLKLYRLMRK